MHVALLGLIAAATATSTATPSAPEEAPSARFGVGMSTGLTLTAGATPIGALSLTYDARTYRVEAITSLTVVQDERTQVIAGLRGLYPLHGSETADISIGATAAAFLVLAERAPDNKNALLELNLQIRAFLTEQVALTGLAGVGLILGDGPTAALVGGQLSGALGLTYYFD